MSADPTAGVTCVLVPSMSDVPHTREGQPLLRPSQKYGSILAAPVEGAAVGRGEANDASGESFDNVPQVRRQLGLPSAAFLIFNRVIGTGIFATPSLILSSSGSVGVALLMWVLGALIAAAGTAVYVELGTGLPRNGGEKNYLEYMYRRPKFMVSCTYGIFTMISASTRNIVHALGFPATGFNTRLAALLCLTFCFVMIGVFNKWSLRLLNVLATFKFAILAGIASLGLLSLAGVPGLAVRPSYEMPHNFASWGALWAGSRRDSNSLITALYNVIWSFIGYSDANYALSEVRDPVRTIKRAAPLAIASLATMYLLVNVAYFAVVSKNDILGSRQIIAALFFRNLFGPGTERALSAFIAVSTLGNILSVSFTQGRVVQELGREGVLPLSAFFATNKPFGAPLAGLTILYGISLAGVVLPPPGDAYLFLISMTSYALALVNTLVSFGLLLLHTRAYRAWEWDPPFRAPHAVVVLFFASNVFLVLVPLIPPAPGARAFEHIPYYMHVVVTIAAAQLGVVYWAVWSVWLPRRNGYTLKREWTLQDDGVSRFVFVKVPAPPPP
ncbi:APC amino acid permease [Mycena pura]|uniref:APC amino acid permease n=1 Tax=Mycena pura TaxID=153505 RepID=A0AAD6YHQ4_9AGAR|nr:APC amino acid permease [Mycena pura]